MGIESNTMVLDETIKLTECIQQIWYQIFERKHKIFILSQIDTDYYYLTDVLCQDIGTLRLTYESSIEGFFAEFITITHPRPKRHYYILDPVNGTVEKTEALYGYKH